MADLRHAFRSLGRNPGFTFAAVLALGLGIGANTAIFTVVNTVLLHPLPYPSSGRIVTIARKRGDASVPMFNYWRDNNCCFEDMAAFDNTAGGLNLRSGNRPELVYGIHVSREFFRLFGASAMLGRTFTAAEDLPKGPKVAVISYALWQRRFGGNPGAAGRPVSLNGESVTIVGVLSPGFQSYPAAEIWTPLQADPASDVQAHYLKVAGRLNGNTTVAGANAAMNVIGRRYAQSHPDQVGNDDQLAVRPMQNALTGDIQPALLILLAAVALVLLLACANVANLLLARATARQREIAIRTAIGAGRGRIVRQLLTESLTLSVLGGCLGLVIGSLGIRALLAFSPGDLPRAEELAATGALNPVILLFTLAVSIAAGVLFGVFPALHASRTELTVSLRENAAGSGSSRFQSRARGLLVSAEIAIAVVLLCGASLLIRSYLALHNQQPGFHTGGLVTFKVSLADPRFATGQGIERVARRVAERISEVPGVQSTALANSLPFEDGIDMIFTVPGRPLKAGVKFHGDVYWRHLSGAYFGTLGIPLHSGRLFRDSEPGRAVIVNEAFARKFFPGQNPLGQAIDIGANLGPAYDQGLVPIIGVVGDVRESGLENDAPPIIYQSWSAVPQAVLTMTNNLLLSTFAIRLQPGVAAGTVIAALDPILREGDIQLSATRIRTMDQLTRDSTARRNFNLLLLAVFAGIALFLAALGIYSVISYAVQQRTREIGIRTALGATRADTLLLVFGQGLVLTALGIAAGVAGAFGLTRFLAAQLYGVQTTDALSFIAVPMLLFVVAAGACLIPAIRALRIDPNIALRYE